VPRDIDFDDVKPRRRKRTAAIAAEPERGFAMRVLMHSPKDTLAAAAAMIVVFGIVGNALFLQAGRHPAPMFGTATIAAAPSAAPLPRTRPVEAEARPVETTKPVEAVAAPSKPIAAPAVSSATPRPPAAIPAKNDPVGDLIVSTRRVAAVQRALTEYGYGQLKPTGVIGPETQAAIQKFERDRKMPITGQLSDKLLRDLVILTGRPIE
jgi:hypothetical protein